MKRGLYLFAIIAFIMIASTASAQLGLQGISLRDLAQSEYVNIGLVFLLVFSVVLFAIKDVFKRSYGAAVIIALVVGVIGSLGVFYFYGPIIPAVAPWIIIVALAIVAIILMRFFRQMRGIIWILAVISLIWFFVTRRNVCGIERWSQDLCVVVDFIMISILIITIFYILFRIFKGWRPASRRREPEQVVLLMETTAGGTTNPPPGEHVAQRGSRVRIVAIPQTAKFKHWVLDGNRVEGGIQAIKLVRDVTHARAVFEGGGGGDETQKRRSIYDLKQKYCNYAFAIHQFRKKNDPKQRQRRLRILQAMTVILNMANRLGCPPSKFLSKDVGNMNVKSPSQIANELRQRGFI